MKMLSSLPMLLLICSLLSSYSFGQTLPQAIDSLLLQRFSHADPGAAVLIYKQGKPLYRKALGKASLELNVDITPDHIFAIGSITKQFTACAILKLSEEGKLSLQDPLTKFIPDYPTHGRHITLEHLLTHSSGIKSITQMEKWTTEVQKKNFSPLELINFLKDEPFDFAPGEQFHYSNTGYILLGYIIELVSGKPYGDYLQDTFFGPLGLTHTSYSSHSRITAQRVAGYQKDKGFYENADYLSVTQPYAAGSVLSTLEDLYQWNQAVMSGRVISLENLQQAHTPYRLNNGRVAPYGYGWRLGNIQGSRSIKHGGLINGYAAFSLYLPAEKVFVAILTNCDCNKDLDEVASQLAAVAIAKPYSTNRIVVTGNELSTYSGLYESSTEPQQQIVNYERGRLMYYRPKGRKVELIPFDKDKFRLGQSLTSIEFYRDASGKVVSFSELGTGMPISLLRTTKPIESREEIAVTAHLLQRYAGNYQLKPGVLFIVTRQANKLYGQMSGPGQTKQELIAYSKHRFYAQYIDVTIEFILGKDKKVTGLTLSQNDKKHASRVE